MTRDELNRLKRAYEKALKKGNIAPIGEWALQFEQQVDFRNKQFYEKEFDKQLAQSIEWYLIAIAYTLHFNQKCKFGKKRLQDVMDDLIATVDLFGNREYTAEDYLQQLKEDGIILNNIGEKE